MSDTNDNPIDPDTSYPESREKQSEFEGLLEEKDGDFQAATDAQLAGEEPDDDERRNTRAT